VTVRIILFATILPIDRFRPHCQALQTLPPALVSNVIMDYRKFITIEPGKRGGKPCVRGLRITVGDVLGWIAAGMNWQEIVDDHPDLTEQDIRACLAYAADREQHTMIALTPHEAAVQS
jgi:uncharacterized protein (DUF433 family)